MLGTVERAFELANSGECRTVGEIEKQLMSEKKEQVQNHLSGPLIRSQLRKACSAASETRKEEASDA